MAAENQDVEMTRTLAGVVTGSSLHGGRTKAWPCEWWEWMLYDANTEYVIFKKNVLKDVGRVGNEVIEMWEWQIAEYKYLDDDQVWKPTGRGLPTSFVNRVNTSGKYTRKRKQREESSSTERQRPAAEGSNMPAPAATPVCGT